jgi:hypothetical protein
VCFTWKTYKTAQKDYGYKLPMTEQKVLTWLSNSTFGSKKVLNYYSALKSYSKLMGYSVKCDTERVRAACRGLASEYSVSEKRTKFINREQFNQLINFCSTHRLEEFKHLCIIGYSLMLRIPSELLDTERSSIIRYGKEYKLKLKTRKNNNKTTVLDIPKKVDNLKPELSASYLLQNGIKIKNTAFNKTLKHCAKCLGWITPNSYASHSLRRGATDEAASKRHDINVIMEKGGWKNKGSLKHYMKPSNHRFYQSN